MKIINRLISILLCILIISAVACVSVYAKTVYIFRDWAYEKINNYTEFEIDEYTGDATSLTTYLSYNSLLITSIGSSAFSSNTTLKEITFNPVLKYVQNNAFLNATALETVVLSENVELIDYSAFNGCTSLKSINLEDSKITKVSKYCFNHCDSLSEVTVPETATSIEEYSFAYCDSLSKVTIPASVTTIDDNAFYSSDNVVIYCYTDSAAHLYAENNGIEYVLLDAVVETYILGDTDGDGKVSVMDSTTLQFVLAFMEADEDGRKAIRSDIDHDGVSSIMDATTIQRYVAQYDDGTDIGNIYEY